MADFVENIIVPNNNYHLEFVLPLLEAKRDERALTKKINKSEQSLGFNIHLSQRNAAVHICLIKDQVRFFYYSRPRESSDGRNEAKPERSLESAWTAAEREEFLTLFARRFPLASTPVLHPVIYRGTRPRRQQPQQEEQQDQKDGAEQQEEQQEVAEDEDNDDDDDDREPVLEFANLKIVGSGRLEMDSNPSSI